MEFYVTKTNNKILFEGKGLRLRFMFSKIILQKSDLHVYTYKIKRGGVEGKMGDNYRWRR